MSTQYLIMVLACLVLMLINCDAAPPNIFFILADDFGWADAGFHRNQPNNEVVTPNIDNLAKTGLELNRHYVHYVCSPTRSSLQSGRLPVHVNLGNADALNQYAGITINMTTIGTRMKSVGYTTAMVGKYDLGMATPQQAPKGRGYDSSLIYFHHENNYWDQTVNSCNGTQIVDLWDTDKPATTLNGTKYEETIFAERIYDLIDNTFNENTPFFMVYTPHVSHAPLMIPKEYLSYYNFSNDEYKCSDMQPYIYPGYPTNKTDYRCRSIEHAMVYFLDEVIGNITAKLKAKNLWDNTLFIFSVDNGGCLKLNACGGNNHPLRGGKFVPFEGGIRATTFVNGGYLPQNRRGKIENGIMHITDWYTTFCGFIGLNCNDTVAVQNGLPNIDGYDMWPLLNGSNTTSPRTEIPIDHNSLIQNEYKYLRGQIDYASWAGKTFPNTTSMTHPVQGTMMNCSKGCLFDVVNDPTEHIDIASNNPDIVQKMENRLNELVKGYWSNHISGTNSCPNNINYTCQCYMAFNRYKGFWGPWQDLN